VRLGTLPLSESITRNIVARKGEIARRQCEAAEKKLLTSKLLPEKAVRFSDDCAGFDLNWLGNAPFMQAQVALPQQTTEDETPCDCGEQTDTGTKPKALVLHVQLSDKTFISGLDKLKTNLKIDVFFNGELASCVLISAHDIRSGTKSLHQVFAGTRVDYLAERPWVLLPTNIMASSVSRFKDVTSPVEERWKAICHVLRREAQARGTEARGHIPPSAEFLEALAYMQMPQELRDMHQPGCRNFGTIDIIISAGDGKKVTSGSGYLNAPQRLVDDRFPLDVNGSQNGSLSQGAGVDVAFSIPPDQRLDDLDAEGESDCDYCPRAKRQAMTACVLARDQAPDATSVHKFMPTAWPSPSSLQGADSARQQQPSRSFLGNESFTAGFFSSPLQQLSLLGTSPSAPTGYNTEPHSMNDSYGTYDAPLGGYNMNFPLNPRDVGHGIAPVAPMYPWIIPTMPTVRLHPPDPWMQQTSTCLPMPPCLSSCNHIPAALLPPTGLYTVPQKPKAKIHSTKLPGITQEKESRLTMLVTRIVIYDQNGPIVDHRWKIAQWIARRHHNTNVTHPRRRILNSSASRPSPKVPSPRPTTENSRCKTPGHSIVGIQGPKATPVWFEDPEEMLREAAKLKRLRSPKKKDSETQSDHEEVFVSSAHDPRAPDTANSSPLSSPPDTPGQADLCLHGRPESPITQLDGCQTPPPSSSMVSANRHLEPTPPASSSLDPKKRKARSAEPKPVIRKWRNNNRILAVSDPPLSRNCVITYAESETTDVSDTGPLRQVRGERQGIFHEEYVVFAARLFVPGTS